MKNILSTLALALSVALSASAMPAQASGGSINLSLNTLHYCATSQTGNDFLGVTNGTCTAPPQPPAGQLTRTNIKYPNISSTQLRRNVDVTLWDNVFGYGTATQATPCAWPGCRGAVPDFYPFTGNGYVALKFTVTAEHQIAIGVSTYDGHATEMNVSPIPGSFVVANALCHSVAGPGGTFTKLSSKPGLPGCPLIVGATYYANLRPTVATTVAAPLSLNISYSP